MAAANSLRVGLSGRKVSHIAFFDLLAAGDTEAALSALPTHLNTWPRDVLVLGTTAFTNGLIGNSGRAGQKRLLLDLLERLAPSYGDDWWFTAHHGMALSENGSREAARPKIERSLVQNPQNPWGAHALAHLCYEEGIQMRPAPSWRPGSQPTRGMARYTATSIGILHSVISKPAIRHQHFGCSQMPSHPVYIAGRRAGS
jgi:hypothetical protein